MARIHAFALSCCLTASVLAWPASAADSTPLPRVVTVNGSGEVAAQPDIARVTLGVEARKPTLAEARAEVAAAVERILGLTRSLKIDPKQVNATALQVQPEYRWNDKDRKRVLLGYFVARQVQVEVRDLDQLGPLLERAIDAGANQVGEPQLDSSRRKELEREALAKAVKDAQANAEVLARAAGVTLGPARTLNAATGMPVVPMYKASRMVMADAAAAPPPEQTYDAGDMKFSASVQAEFDLLVPQQSPLH
jgi:hypothetical protein